MDMWMRNFDATYIRDDGVVVVDDRGVPLPEGFPNDPKLRSNVVFPPRTRAGDHIHNTRHEVFVGFGEGLELVVEDPKTKKVEIFKMDPKFYDGKCVVFWIKPGLPHAVRNAGPGSGYLLEFASHKQEKEDYFVGEAEYL